MRYFSLLFALLGCACVRATICNNFSYYEAPALPDEAGFIVTYTASGVTAFVREGMDLAIDYLGQVQIPPFTYRLDTALGGVEFTAKNIRFTELAVDSYDMQLRAEKNLSVAEFRGIGIRLTLDFALRQTTAPFLTDEGWAELTLSDTGVRAGCVFGISTACPNHMNVSIPYLSIGIGDLDITLHSPLSTVFEALLSLLKQPIILFLESLVETTVKDALTGFLNDKFAYMESNRRTIYGIRHKPDCHGYVIFIDTRFAGFSVGADAVSVRFPGLEYYTYYDEATGTYVLDRSNLTAKPGAQHPLPSVVNSDHVQYIIDRSAINAVFATWTDLNKTFDGAVCRNASDVARDLLSAETLEGVFPGISEQLARVADPEHNVFLRYAHTEAPHVPAVTATGLFTEFLLNVSVVARVGDAETTLAAAHVRVGALGLPTVYTTSIRPTLNYTSFYCDYAFGNMSVVGRSPAPRAEQGPAGDAALEVFVSTLFDEAIGPAVAGLMQERSVHTDNGLFFCNARHRFTMFPPDYFSVSANLEE